MSSRVASGDKKFTRSGDTAESPRPYRGVMRRRAAAPVLAAALCTASPAFVPTPAEAASAGVITFTGSMSVGNGIAYPCLDGKSSTPQFNVQKCGGVLTSQNMAAVTLGSYLAVGAFGNGPTSATKSNTVETGAFTIAALGVISGACNLSSGTMSGTISPVIAVGTKFKMRSIFLTFSDLAGIVFITGMTSKGEGFFGPVHKIPTTGTCMNKTAKTFTVSGTLVFAQL